MKKVIKNILVYFLAIFVIIQNYSLISLIYPNFIFYISINIILFILILFRRKHKVSNRIIFLILLYLLSSAILLLGDFFYFEFVFSCITSFVLGCIYFDNSERVCDFLEKYTNVVVVISTISLFFFLFGSIFKMIEPSKIYFSEEIQWGANIYKDFFHIYCEGQEVFALGYKGVRNIAIFAEGPMLIYVLSFAIFYEMFFRKKTRKMVVIIITLTIITSLSTTGLLILAVLFYLKFMHLINKNRFLKYILIPFITVIIICLGIYILQDKFESNVYSSSVRIDDIISSFKCFANNPINGVGYGNMKAIDPYRSYYRSSYGLSTGIGAVFAYGGLMWAIWYCLPPSIAIIKLLITKEKKYELYFVLMSFVLLLVTVVQSRILCTLTNVISWLIIVNNYKLRNRNKE